MTIPATMLALAIPLILLLIAIICGESPDRPKPFDMDGWDNGLARRVDKA